MLRRLGLIDGRSDKRFPKPWEDFVDGRGLTWFLSCGNVLDDVHGRGIDIAAMRGHAKRLRDACPESRKVAPDG